MMDMERLAEALKWAGPSDSEQEDVFDAARELVDAPRMWWCGCTRIDEEGAVRGWLPGSTLYEMCKRTGGCGHSGCGWVRLVKEDN